jgi:DNA-binding response OmpR family regulator
VLIAHIKANIRRANMRLPKDDIIRVRELEIETAVHIVRKRGEELLLSPTEYQLLCYLAVNRGRFVSFEEIYSAIWQKPSLADYRSLFVHIRNLRKKLEDNPAEPVYIVTQRRNGYIFFKS